MLTKGGKIPSRGKNPYRRLVAAPKKSDGFFTAVVSICLTSAVFMLVLQGAHDWMAKKELQNALNQSFGILSVLKAENTKLTDNITQCTAFLNDSTLDPTAPIKADRVFVLNKGVIGNIDDRSGKWSIRLEKITFEKNIATATMTILTDKKNNDTMTIKAVLDADGGIVKSTIENSSGINIGVVGIQTDSVYLVFHRTLAE